MKPFAICLLVVCGAVAAAAQPAMQNHTGLPDDIAAARFLGIADAIVSRCPNLEVTPAGEAMFLAMGRISRLDIERSARLRGAYDGGAASIQLQEFDPECAGPLQQLRLLLRVRADHPVPAGPGWTRQNVVPRPLR